MIANWVATQGFLPHGYCFQWSSDLLTLMVVSNLIIAVSYYAIPIALMVFLDKQRVKLSWLFMLFAAFIFFCGTTHILDIITIWYPAYWIQGWMKAATGFVSLAAAILTWLTIWRVPRLQVTRYDTSENEITALKIQVDVLNAELERYRKVA